MPYAALQPLSKPSRPQNRCPFYTIPTPIAHPHLRFLLKMTRAWYTIREYCSKEEDGLSQ